MILSLVDQLAAAVEQAEDRRAALTRTISESLIKMGLIHPTFAMPELSGLRAQYSVAFLRLMSQARAQLPVTTLSLPPPDTSHMTTSNMLPTFFRSR